MDPYKSPQAVNDEPNQPAQASPPPPKRVFRWRVIPACICWLIGGLMLFAFPMAVWNNWKYLGVDLDGPLPWLLLDIVQMATILFFLGFGLALLYAGNRWIKGRWIWAIALTVIPWLLMAALKEVTEYLEHWALEMP
ncbi:hypothetical protein [Bremerella sp. P1]|uniref:hypothetical protein n=1 Tax=Bremerella sp. P1 TaxID=3026424 RepID=UPI002367BE11|nr:hypothetical protein [Bremerella sp. P1]WDI44197.1 hypothetical protein PSR63_09660 [Bremerella sp. P1]